MNSYWLAGTFFSLLLLGIAVLLPWRRLRVRRHVGDIHASLADCGVLLHLAAEIQQHRGLSSAWLSGNSSAEAKVRSKRQSIESQFHALREIVGREERQAVPCICSNELRLFLFHWRELCDGLASSSVEHSFSAHSQLVQKILAWLEAVGDARIALARLEQVPSSAARNIFQRLPLLTEVLGQARAIGSAAAVRGSCSPVARVRLMFLVARAESLLAQVRRALPGMPQQEDACRAVEQMGQAIRGSLLARSGTMVAADQYFAIASAAIDAVYDWIFVLTELIAEDTAKRESHEVARFVESH